MSQEVIKLVIYWKLSHSFFSYSQCSCKGPMCLTPQYFNVRSPVHPTIQDYPKIGASRNVFNILPVKLEYGQLQPGSLREDYGIRLLGIDVDTPFVGPSPNLI